MGGGSALFDTCPPTCSPAGCALVSQAPLATLSPARWGQRHHCALDTGSWHRLSCTFAPTVTIMSKQLARKATVERQTRETQISLSLNLDGSGQFQAETGLPFLEHMLEQVARHGLLDLAITARGDLAVDAHHTVEDLGITLGQALNKALTKTGIRRYGHAYVPLDEALSRVVIDFSGRPGLEYHLQFARAVVGNFDVDLFREFFQGFVNHAQVTLHIDNIRGRNAHHQSETVFKAFGRAVRMAVELDPRAAEAVPSTKGVL